MSKLKWGLIGGGAGSQIGPIHRLSARLDNQFELVAGALDHRPEAARAFALELGISEERAYSDWRDMLEQESNRVDRVDLVTVATPNSSHYEITKAFLLAGFHVLCEKPMTMSVSEAEEIVEICREIGSICAVNYGYTGYSLVRHMKAMVARGDLGKIRLVVTEFSHGHHADVEHQNNQRVRWRYDPEITGVSAQFADCGIHALHLASFITGQVVERLSADFAHCIEERLLEDDAMVNFRMSEGVVGRLWTSSVAIGRQHGLTIQIFGEKGGLRWCQEQPNQLYYTPLNQRLQIIERGESGLSPEADRTSRVTIGHAEGMPLAFANIYKDLAEVIKATKLQLIPADVATSYPNAEDGLRSMVAIHAAVASAKDMGIWVDAVPEILRNR